MRLEGSELRVEHRRSLAVLALAMSVLRVLLPDGAVRAETRPPVEQGKIDWLLSQIQHSGGVFIRNGSEYSAEKAVGHLKSKLKRAGTRVQTARDFIKGIASRSETTGKPYEIRTRDGQQLLLEKWLREKLLTYEKESGPR